MAWERNLLLGDQEMLLFGRRAEIVSHQIGKVAMSSSDWDRLCRERLLVEAARERNVAGCRSDLLEGFTVSVVVLCVTDLLPDRVSS